LLGGFRSTTLMPAKTKTGFALGMEMQVRRVGTRPSKGGEVQSLRLHLSKAHHVG